MKNAQIEQIKVYKDTIIQVIVVNMVTDEELIRKSVFGVLENLVEKLKDDPTLLDKIIRPFIEKTEKMNEDSNEYSEYLKVFDNLLGINSPRILKYLNDILFNLPVEQYKIDIITNNAEILGLMKKN